MGVMRQPARGRTRRRLAFAVSVVATLGWPAVASPATPSRPGPAAAASAGELLDLAQLLPDPAIIHPDIAARVAVRLDRIGTLTTELSHARRSLADAEGRLVSSRAAQVRLTIVESHLEAEVAIARAEESAARVVLEDSRSDLGSFAIGTFVESGTLDLITFSTEVEPSPIPALAGAAEDSLLNTRAEAAERFGAATIERYRLVDALGQARIERAAARTAAAGAERDRAMATAQIERIVPVFESALLLAPVVGTDFPVVVLDAYYRAALATAVTRPRCGVRWDQLAGIGRVESRHGTYGGTSVGADGRTNAEILGPVLDGTRFASIPDTDGGAWDGDPVWDRAVGPMQFIPGSWKRYGADGNGDGVADPHNLYDAALAAANHLCGSASGLGDGLNYQRALLGYNRSVTYGLTVMGYAGSYRNAVDLGDRTGLDPALADRTAPAADSATSPNPAAE